jgi:hypothetical protein
MFDNRLADFFDRACTEILALEEQNSFAARLKVSQETYDLLASLRQRELCEGFDLVVLGLTVEATDRLAPGDFRVAH